MLDGAEVCELELRAARGRRRSRSRHVRALRRLRTRRRRTRLLLVTSAVAAFALAQGSGPRSEPGLSRGAAPVRCPVPSQLRPAFLTASRATGVELGLLAAVARVESRFDPDARSRAGAVGLLQLMPATAAELHYDPQDLPSNVMAGAVYLRLQLVRYGSTELALAAYNAGPSAVDRLGASPNGETAAYVARVTRTRLAFGSCG